MRALTPGCLSLTQRGIPDSQHMNLPVVLSPTTLVRSISAFFALVCSRVLDSSPQRRCSSARTRSLGLRHSLAGSPLTKAESSFFRTDRQDRLPLLPTPSSDDAVTVGFQPVERLVERVPTSFSCALSGALAKASGRHNRPISNCEFRISDLLRSRTDPRHPPPPAFGSKFAIRYSKSPRRKANCHGIRSVVLCSQAQKKTGSTCRLPRDLQGLYARSLSH